MSDCVYKLTARENNLGEMSERKFLINLDKMPIFTPVFTPIKEDSAKFYFEVLFQRIGDEKTSLHVILRKFSESSGHSLLHFDLSVFVYYNTNRAGSVLYTSCKSDEPIELKDFKEKFCIKIVSASHEKYGSQSHGQYICSNKLVLKCVMNFYGHITSPTSYHSNMNALDNLKSLTKNFEAIYQSKELSDVDIQLGDKTFKCHKFVLAAHSPVFKTMVMQDFQEAKTGVIAISDIEPDIFESFLKLLYTGEVEENAFSSNFQQLYTFADKYDVQILREECYKILTDSSLDEDEICEIILLARQCKDDNLTKVAKRLLVTTIKKQEM